jgi:hypothetical protein
MPSRFAWDRKVAAYAGIFNLLADVAGDPVLAVPLRDARGHISTDRHRFLTGLILRTWKLLNSRQGDSAAVLT